MRRSNVIWVIAGVAVACAAVAVLVFIWPALGNRTVSAGVPDFAVGYCLTNDDIAPRERAALEDAARHFIEVLQESPTSARALMSRTGRAATVERASLEAPSAMLNGLNRTAELQVRDTHLLRFTGGSPRGVRASCDFRDGRAAFANRGVTWTTGIVLFTQEIAGGSAFTYTTWLEREGGDWKIRAAHFTPTKFSGRDAREAWRLAQAERAAGHDLNAVVLYSAAREALRGPAFFQERDFQDFEADYATFEPAPLLRGAPPLLWWFGQDRFRINSAQVMAFAEGKIAIMIVHTPTVWGGDEEIEALNQNLRGHIERRFPEWRTMFDALIVRAARENSNELWTSVFENEPPRAAPAAN